MTRSPRSGRRRMVFLEDMGTHSVHEVCLGAAEYAAGQSDLDFEPWPLAAEGAGPPTRRDFLEVDCLLLTERSCRAVFGSNPKIKLPHLFILADQNHSGAPAVSLDERAIGEMAAEHLIGRGYRTLASVVSTEGIWSQYRAEGFERVCRRHGVEPARFALPKKTLPVFWHSNFSRRNAELVGILSALPKPCGIFAANDVVASFLIETARCHGLRVPQQVGIIGVDDDPVPNAAAGMAISSVQPPFREVGRQAAALLDRLHKDGRIPPRLFLSPIRVMPRTSTNAFMVEDSVVRRAQSYIEERRGGLVRVSEVIKAVGTTPITLLRRFQRHLQIKPFDYILLRRIEHAAELLREGDLNIQEVASSCGFHSSSYFCRLFKRVTGRLPREVHRGGVAAAARANVKK